MLTESVEPPERTADRRLRIPGLPSTIAYLPGELGPTKVVEYFFRKIGSSSSG